MKRKELTKTFMMISNCRNPLRSLLLYENMSALQLEVLSTEVYKYTTYHNNSRSSDIIYENLDILGFHLIARVESGGGFI